MIPVDVEAPVPVFTFARLPPHNAFTEWLTLMLKLSKLRLKVNTIGLIVRVVTKVVGVVILVEYDDAPPQLTPPLRPVVKLTVLLATVVTTTCPLTQQQNDGQEVVDEYEPSQFCVWTQPMEDRTTNRTIYVCIFDRNGFFESINRK